MYFTDTVKAALLAAVIAAVTVPGIATALGAGDTVGKSEAEIRAALEAAGYSITEFEVEDGEIEVEAMLDGTLWEVEVSPETGVILEVEEEDDDD